MIAALSLLAAAWAGTAPIKAPLPMLELGGMIYIQASPVSWHSCKLIAVVDQHGYVRTTLIEDCPEPLQYESMNALQRWDFYPPSDGGIAREEEVLVDFRFISGVVLTDPAPGDERPRVRLAPAALPLWPVAPKLKGANKRAALAAGETGLMCSMTLTFNARGMPDDVQRLSCPDDAAELALHRLSRYGVKMVEAEPGDDTRFLFEVWMPAGRNPQKD